mgnify:FL=1|tara:strand:- start:1592 stop:1801 length:210 start_codon:yes stop_codon:yes gene_type:complete
MIAMETMITKDDLVESHNKIIKSLEVIQREITITKNNVIKLSREITVTKTPSGLHNAELGKITRLKNTN